MKKLRNLAAIFLAANLVLPTVSSLAVPVLAAPETSKTNEDHYYGSRLTDEVSIAFYNTLESMDFVSGESKVVTGSQVAAEAAKYALGDDTLIRHFGAAVDSFRYDHMELFYVDFDMLTISVGSVNGGYEVRIGSGRTDTYLMDKTADIQSQIDQYDAALDQLVSNIDEQGTVKEKAKEINDRICDMVTYSFCTDAEGNQTPNAPYISTASVSYTHLTLPTIA